MSTTDPDAALVFLTGASGFIGGRLARSLAGRGYRLRCLVRSPGRAAALSALGAELVVGDTADERVMREGLDGARFAMHIAGQYDLGAVDREAMMRANVGGTRAFLAALNGAMLDGAQVGRALYTSSTAALGPTGSGGRDASADVVDGDDIEWHGPYPSFYHRTKTEAHHLALQAQRDGLPLMTVCPSYVYGPGDNGPAGRYLADLLRHRVPGLSTRPAWFSYVHVDDVVDGMVAAIERGRTGTTYVLSGEPCSVNDFTHRVLRLAETWGPPLRVPPSMVRLTGAMMDAVGRVFGVRMPVSRELADTAATGDRWLHSHARATAELGYAPRSLDDGLPGTVRDAKARIGV